MGRLHIQRTCFCTSTGERFLRSFDYIIDNMQWNDGRIIALMVIAFVLLIAFIVIQIWRPERATVPPRIFLQRSIASGFFVSCCLGAHQTLLRKSPQ